MNIFYAFNSFIPTRFNMRLLLRSLTASIVLASSATWANAALISEFSPDQPGPDGTTQNFEISGIAGMNFTGFVLGISGNANSMGVVDTAFSFSQAFDSNGLLVVNINDLIDPTHTIVLVTDFTGQAGGAGATDIDPFDNGQLELGTLIGIQDAIGIADIQAAIDAGGLYGSRLGGQDFAFTGDQPRLVFRDASVGAWYAINDPDRGQIFDINANDIAGSVAFGGDPFNTSFGAINPTAAVAVPEPTTFAAMLAVTAYGIVRLRRRRKQS